MPLSSLKNNFTHYDLHLNNIIIYEPVKNSYIQYHYYLENNEIVSFKSPFIAKIIDYGGSFFDDKNKNNTYSSSNKILSEICDICENCGIAVGFGKLKDDPVEISHYISSKTNNISHDLRLLYSLIGLKNIRDNNSEFYNLLNKLLKYNSKFGTPEITEDGFNMNDISKSSINNVVDGMYFLKYCINNIQKSSYENKYSNYQKLGDMYIYYNGRSMEWIPFSLQENIQRNSEINSRTNLKTNIETNSEINSRINSRIN